MKGEARFVGIGADNAGMVYGLVRRVYEGFEDVTVEAVRDLVSTAMYSMAALVNNRPVAFASSIGFPGAVEVRNLAVYPGYGAVLRRLLEVMLSRLEPELGSRLVRVSALGTPSIIEAVSALGLNPVRRILKVRWVLGSHATRCAGKVSGKVSVIRVSELGQPEYVARAYLEGIRTHWDWWIRSEKGGYEPALADVTRWLEENPSRWFAATIQDRIVGASGYNPHRRLAGAVWLAGVAVRPEYRLSGIGWALLCAVLDSASGEGFREAVVYTYSPMTGLAPGATLYLKSGGLIQAEYVHFEGRLDRA